MSAGDLARALEGFRFIGNARLVTGRLLRRPRSKKYRIRKKWAKRPGNMAYEPQAGLYYCAEERTVIGHPATLAALRERIARSAAAGAAAAAATREESGVRS